MILISISESTIEFRVMFGDQILKLLVFLDFLLALEFSPIIPFLHARVQFLNLGFILLYKICRLVLHKFEITKLENRFSLSR